MKYTYIINVLSGPLEGSKFELKEGVKITIGRDPKNNIIFKGSENNAVSRSHAFIENNGSDCLITDRSSNGTYINGEKYINESISLKDKDIISFMVNRNDLSMQVVRSLESNPLREQDKTSASFTKILPTNNPGFLKNITEQAFFLPSILTVIFAILLFWSLQIDFTTYSTILGTYLCLMTLFFIKAIAGSQVPFWFLFATSIISITLYYIAIPWIMLEEIFRTAKIVSFLDSEVFVERFIGHFFAAGLHEELFKVIPLFIFLLLRGKFESLHLPGVVNGKVSPVLAILIGGSSAVGFIFHETMFDYVPRYAEDFGELVGLAILIPRIISGIAGHVGFTGIFSYFIGLSFYYSKFNIKIFLLGWLLSSLLHGLWNSLSGNIFLGLIISVSTFIIFVIYLSKAKESFTN
jgi:RsiW-degrading membrane proteinase PrsW (M82 family)